MYLLSEQENWDNFAIVSGDTETGKLFADRVINAIEEEASAEVSINHVSYIELNNLPETLPLNETYRLHVSFTDDDSKWDSVIEIKNMVIYY